MLFATAQADYDIKSRHLLSSASEQFPCQPLGAIAIDCARQDPLGNGQSETSLFAVSGPVNNLKIPRRNPPTVAINSRKLGRPKQAAAAGKCLVRQTYGVRR